MHRELLKASLFTPISGGRWGLPLLAWGEPGVAKTAMIEEVCGQYGLPCETLSPSERGEGAFGVVPVPESAGDRQYLTALSKEVAAYLAADIEPEAAIRRALQKVGPGSGASLLTYPRPDWTQRFDADGRGVVFVDEATSTPPALQAPLMGLILARRIGGHVLPPGVRMLAAANPTDIAAGGFDLATPVANRLGHVEWKPPSIEEHVAYMLRGTSGTGGGTDEAFSAEDEEKRVLKAWPEAWARAVGLETAFLQRRPNLKNVCPKVGDPKGSRGWPSDRSWEAATRALASAEVHSLNEAETEEFVAAFISEGVASEFFEFVKANDLPDPVEVLEGRVKFKHNPARLDRTVALLSACTALVTPAGSTNRKDRSAALWKMFEVICANKSDMDIVVPSVNALMKSDLHAMREAAETLAILHPVLKASNTKPGGR